MIPTFSLAMGSGQPALSRRDLTGISSTDLATANALLATLGGYIDGYSQTFNVTSTQIRVRAQRSLPAALSLQRLLVLRAG